MFVLVALTAALGWAVLRQGAVQPADRLTAALAVAIVAVAGVLTKGRPAPRLSPWIRWPALLLPAYAVFQVIPLPAGLAGWLSPARADHLDALARAGQPMAFAPISVNPAATLQVAITMTACLLIILTVRELAWRHLDGQWALAVPLAILAAFQGALGLLQYFLAWPNGVARGTYVNRNHYAGLLEMALPFALLYAVSVLRERRSPRESPLGPVAKAAPFLVMASLILAGIVYSFSRMGYLSTFIALFVIGAVPFGARLSPGRRSLAIGSVAVLIVLALVLLPPSRLILRFADLTATDTLTSEGRVELYRESVPLIAAYPVFGCGLGGFESAFRKFKKSEPLLRDDYIHNDYLQYLAELGVAGFALAAVLLGGLAAKAWRAAAAPDPATRWLGLACTAAMTAILLHSFADFNLYIPANAMTLSWISGIASGLEFR